jgi:UDP-N-acetylmuramate--alanine ligase
VRESDTLAALRAAGTRIGLPHHPDHLGDATHVVYTAAVREDNPELTEARRRGLPCITRAEMLGRVMQGKRGLAIAGTHGKTTTTGMSAAIFLAAEADPSILIGGDWSPIAGNARRGGGPHFLTEACEAFNSFLELHPFAALITNVEADHLDWHGSLEGVILAFQRFLGQVAPGGYVLGNIDSPPVRSLLANSGRRAVSFGMSADADYRPLDLLLDRPRPEFQLSRRGERLGEIELGVPGEHNVLNAVAAAALALEEGLPFAAVQEGLASFQGVGRRFEVLGEARGVLVIDDYAHHPTEVAATLNAARRALNRRVVAVFQPHLYSRTKLLLNDFAGSFGDADEVIITDIYAAREDPLPGVTGEALARRIRERSPGAVVRFAPDREALVQQLAAGARSGDVVLTLGAGDIRETGEQLVRLLHRLVQEERELAAPGI